MNNNNYKINFIKNPEYKIDINNINLKLKSDYFLNSKNGVKNPYILEHVDYNKYILSKYKLNICLTSDFFYPSFGGVENHMFQIATFLQRFGHKVIILTHYYEKDRIGERFIGNGIKVYYLPFYHTANKIVYPNLSFSTMGYTNEVLLKESISLVHIHQATSTLGTDVFHVACILGIPCVFTDHSLFGINDLAGVNISKVTKSAFVDIDEFICVSYTGRDNLYYRTNSYANNIHVIPNCIDFNKFKLKELKKHSIDNNNTNFNFNINNIPYDKLTTSKPYPINDIKLTLVSISRQVYRKGTDLLIEMLPILYKIFPNMTFLIGGDGSKKYLLDNTVETFKMEDRVKLLGALSHDKVKGVLEQGDIYLNTSLTETFCIAILEAASCGLFVVSTDIGGVKEVLPEHMRILVNCKCDDIIEGIIHAVNHYDSIKRISSNFHYELKECYTYHNAAYMTESVYYDAILLSDKSFKTRIKKILNNGKSSSYLNLLLIFCQLIVYYIFHVLFAKTNFKCKEFDYEKYILYLKDIENKRYNKSNNN